MNWRDALSKKVGAIRSRPASAVNQWLDNPDVAPITVYCQGLSPNDLMPYVGTINTRPFCGAASGALLLTGFSLDREPKLGVDWEGTISFAIARTWLHWDAPAGKVDIVSPYEGKDFDLIPFGDVPSIT